jgi:hypothetical protein
MEEGIERNEGTERPKKYEFFSKVVRAGRRTYFFDVRATQGSDYYVTITESKKCINPDGRIFYEKHKIFLYPEDFDAFAKGLSQISSYARNADSKSHSFRKPNQTEHLQEVEAPKAYDEVEEVEQPVESLTNVDLDFDDLGSKK